MSDLPKAVEEFVLQRYKRISFENEEQIQASVDVCQDLLDNPDSPVRIALEASRRVYHGAPLKDFEMLKQALAALEIK